MTLVSPVSPPSPLTVVNTVSPPSDVPPLTLAVKKPRKKPVVTTVTTVPLPSSSSTTDPLPVVPVVPLVRRRAGGNGVSSSRQLPSSPRTAVAALSTPFTSYAEVKKNIDGLARSINRFSQISAGVARSGKGGTYTTSGKTYSTTDVKEMSSSLSTAITKLPGLCRTAFRRNNVKLSDEERGKRIAAHLELARSSTEDLFRFAGLGANAVKGLTRAVVEKEKHFLQSAKGTVKVPSAEGNQISNCFYISDQFVEFIRNGNFGNGLALFFPGLSDATHEVSGAEKPDVALDAVCTELKLTREELLSRLELTLEEARQLADPRRLLSPLLFERRVATSPLLMTLLARYIRVNHLREESGRIRVDANMRKHLGGSTNTRLFLNGNDVSETDMAAKVAAAVIAKEPESDAKERLTSAMAKSGVERLRTRKTTAKGEVPYDGKSFLRTMSIVIATYYRISSPPESLTQALKSKELTSLAMGLNVYF